MQDIKKEAPQCLSSPLFSWILMCSRISKLVVIITSNNSINVMNNHYYMTEKLPVLNSIFCSSLKTSPHNGCFETEVIVKTCDHLWANSTFALNDIINVNTVNNSRPRYKEKLFNTVCELFLKHLFWQTKSFRTLPCDMLHPQNVSICSIVHVPSHSLHILKIHTALLNVTQSELKSKILNYLSLQ